MGKRKKWKTPFGKLKFDKDDEEFYGDILQPFFKNNTCSLTYPFNRSDLDFDDLNKSFVDNGEEEETEVFLKVNCHEGESVSESQMDTLDLVYANLEKIEAVVYSKLKDIRKDYLDTHLFNRQTIRPSEKEVAEKQREILESFLSQPDIEKNSFCLDGISFLAGSKYEACFALDFYASWELEGFCLLFKGLELLDVAELYEFSDW